MGCDIHLKAEKKVGNAWVNIDKWTPNPDYGEYPNEPEKEVSRENRFYTDGRNYNLFCALAGVRAWEFKNEAHIVSKPKGFPSDADALTRQEYDQYSTDAHSASWLTLEELKAFDWAPYGTTCDDFRNEVLPKMEAQGVPDTDVRIVFFFDN